MKLGEPITNANGVTIMPSGIRLTPMFIARIRKWNIDTIDILQEKKADAAAGDNGDAMTEKDQQEAQAQASQNTRVLSDRLSQEQAEFARTVALEVSRTFVNVKNDPLMMQLRTVAIKRLVHHGCNGVVNVMRRHGENGEEGRSGDHGEEREPDGS